MSDVEAQEQRLAEAVDANREALAALQAVTTAGSGGSGGSSSSSSSSSVADRVDGARRPAAAKGLGTSSDEEWGELQKMHAQIKEGAAETARAISEIVVRQRSIYFGTEKQLVVSRDRIDLCSQAVRLPMSCPR